MLMVLTLAMQTIYFHFQDMPDPIDAHETIWIPFMRDELKCGENSVIIGKTLSLHHSVYHMT